jgi:putative hydrolase of the HAD superfamily
LAPLFELVLVEGELGFGKPDARVFRRALDHFGIAASEACMIGDNLEADIKAAQTMGLRTLWHDAYGTGLPQNAPCRPDGVLRELGELLPR